MRTIAFEDDQVDERVDVVGFFEEEDSRGLVNVFDPEFLEEAQDESKLSDGLVETAQALESIYLALEGHSSSPMTLTEATLLKTALKRLDPKTDGRSVILEAYTDNRSALRGTRLAMEDLAERIREIVINITKWLKRVMKVISEAIERAVRGANAYSEKAKRLQDMAMKVKANSKLDLHDVKITDRGLLNFFNKNGATYSTHEILTRYMEYNSTLNVHFSNVIIKESTNALASFIQLGVERSGIENYQTENALQASNLAIKIFKERSLTGFTPKTDHRGDLMCYAFPFGNQELQILLGYKVSNDIRYYDSISTHFETLSRASAPHLPILKPDEILGFARAIETQMNSGIYRDSKQILKYLREADSHIDKVCYEIVKAQRYAGNGVVNSLHFLQSFTSTLIVLIKELYKYNGTAARKMFQYCYKSLAYYPTV